jgi:GSH-dependent disulfide-bond oxidoreductase
MVNYPWLHSHGKQTQNLDDFPHLKEWLLCMSERSAVIKAYKMGITVCELAGM